jgi:hypothetical protein
MLISVHMPKTAGTSFLNSLQKVFGERLLQHYSTPPDSTYMSDRAALLKYKFGVIWKGRKIVRRYDAIHGHFVPETFSFLPGPKQFCVFLREPVDRTISHYLYWEKMGPLQIPRHSVLDHVVRNHLTLNDFAALPEIVNYYSTYLGRMSLEKFDFVGLQEEYNTSLCLFEKIFGVKLEEYRDNVVNREQYEHILSSVDLAKLRLAQAKNREVYDQARRRFDLLCSQYL